MTPFEQAVQVYQQEPCYRTFDEDLRLHLRHGYVFSTPKFFMMVRPVNGDGWHERMVDPAGTYLACICNCWHVHCLAGDIPAALEMLKLKSLPDFPRGMTLVSWQRNNVLRIYRLDAVLRLVTRGGHDIPVQRPQTSEAIAASGGPGR